MAYTRWSEGPWYIYWHTDSGKTRDTQVLWVGLAQGAWADVDPEMAEDMLTSDIWPAWPTITEEEREEAREAIREWLEDVDEQYPKTGG